MGLRGLDIGSCRLHYVVVHMKPGRISLKSAYVDIGGASSWIKINVDQTGFYRVKYDDTLAAKLRLAIESKLLSPTDRYG